MAEVDQTIGEHEEAEQVIENAEAEENEEAQLPAAAAEEAVAAVGGGGGGGGAGTGGGGGEKKWPGWPGESVFRMLVPAQKVGGIIGRKGEFIKKLVEETRARIKILDGPPGTSERAVQCSNFKGNDSIID